MGPNIRLHLFTTVFVSFSILCQVKSQYYGQGYRQPPPPQHYKNAQPPQTIYGAPAQKPLNIQSPPPLPPVRQPPVSYLPIPPEQNQYASPSNPWQNQQPPATTTTTTTTTTPRPTTTVRALPPVVETEEHISSSAIGMMSMDSIKKIDVLCGLKKMSVFLKFDKPFEGTIYAKDNYNDPSCQYVSGESPSTEINFDMVTGECGVSYVDQGLTSGGSSYIEGVFAVNNEQGIVEAWDTEKTIRCIWKGNLEESVISPVAVLPLDSNSPPLLFSGDIAMVTMEIRQGHTLSSPNVRGPVRIGQPLSAVVTVHGDNEFDIFVKDCYATDSSKLVRYLLTDTQGCAKKLKVMGGWKKEKVDGKSVAIALISAFRFPDVMELYFECTVDLCKGKCPECSQFMELKDAHAQHSHDHDDDPESLIDPRAKNAFSRSKRFVQFLNQTHIANIEGEENSEENSAERVLKNGEQNARSQLIRILDSDEDYAQFEGRRENERFKEFSLYSGENFFMFLLLNFISLLCVLILVIVAVSAAYCLGWKKSLNFESKI